MTDLKTKIGRDGFPVPTAGKRKALVRCICQICWQPYGRVSLTKKGGYYIQCGVCRAQIFLNDPHAISLWRGTQLAMEQSSDLYDLISTQTAALAPPIDGARPEAHPGRSPRG